MKTKLVIGSAVLALLLVVAGPTAAGEERRELSKEQAHEILKGLEQGMVALEKLGRREDAQRLGRIANELREKLHGQTERRHPERAKEGDQRERKELAHHIEVMIWGVKALVEAERHDAADLLERAVHARKMDLAGRRDEESMMIRRKSPGVGDIAELLLHAGAIWKEFGNADRAEAVHRLGRHYQELYHRARAEKAERERGDRPKPEGEHRDRPRPEGEQRDRPRTDRPGADEARERLARLERQLEEMMHAMKRLTGEMERIKKEFGR